MATFITSRSVGQFISISITTSTGYWKSNHNGTDSTVFTSGPFSNLTVQNANGEFTIIPCDIIGNPSGDITGMLLGNTFFNQNQIITFDGTGLSNLTELGLGYNQLTSFDGTGLTGLTSLNLEYNQLTTFNGTGLSSLTNLNLRNNQFMSFDATGLTSLTDLRLNDNQLTSVNVSGLTSLALLNLFNNQLTSIDVSSLTNLTNLSVNGNLLDSADNDLILAQLVANGKNNGSAATTGGRTPAGDNDFNTLQNRGWFLLGFSDNTTTTTTTSGPTTTTTTTSGPTTTTTTTSAPPPTQPVTFVTSKAVGQKINPSVFTGTGYWRVYHNNSYSAIYSNGSAPFGISVENPNGEFTVIACDISGNPGGIINELNLYDNQLTSFDGTGLTSLITLYLNSNQLTSFNGTGLSSLTQLNLNYNQLTSFNGTGLSSLTDLYLGNNQLTASTNDSILSQLAAYSIDNGFFATVGGRTSAGTADYNTLIGRGWIIQGANLPIIGNGKLAIKGINQI